MCEDWLVPYGTVFTDIRVTYTESEVSGIAYSYKYENKKEVTIFFGQRSKQATVYSFFDSSRKRAHYLGFSAGFIGEKMVYLGPLTANLGDPLCQNTSTELLG